MRWMPAHLPAGTARAISVTRAPGALVPRTGRHKGAVSETEYHSPGHLKQAKHEPGTDEDDGPQLIRDSQRDGAHTREPQRHALPVPYILLELIQNSHRAWVACDQRGIETSEGRLPPTPPVRQLRSLGGVGGLACVVFPCRRYAESWHGKPAPWRPDTLGRTLCD